MRFHAENQLTLTLGTDELKPDFQMTLQAPTGEQFRVPIELDNSTEPLDAVDLAYSRLQSLGDSERINAVVVMTDGRENHSRVQLGTLMKRIMRGNETGVPVVIFTVGYGSDADEDTLRALAESSGGQYYTGDLDTIRRLYKILTTYF